MNRKQKYMAMTLAGSLFLNVFGLIVGTAFAAATVGTDENFNSLPVGNFSAPNWTPTLTPDGSIRVVADAADPANKSVRLEKTTTTATSNLTLDRKNLSVSGKAIIGYRLKTDETTGTKSAPYVYGAGTSYNMISLSVVGANINAYNGSSSSAILTGFQAGKWYNIQFVLDTVTKKYDAYIDGVKKATAFSFRDTTANTDTLTLIRYSMDKAQQGTIQFDDLFVDQLPDSLSMESAYHLSLNSAHASQVSAVYSDHSVDITDNVTYSSSNSSIAAVDASGNVKGNALGTAVITASFGGLTATSTVTVTPGNVLNDVQLDQADYLLNEGQQLISVLTAVYSSGPIQANGLPGAVFVSSNPAVAYVDVSSGLIQALHYGTSVLTATYGDKTATSTITVLPILQNLNLVSPGSGGMDLSIGGSAASVTKAVYSDGQTYDITQLAAYQSANHEVADVDAQGKVVALAQGSTVITVTYGAQSVTFPVRVSSLKLDQTAYSLAIGALHATVVSRLNADGSEIDVTSQSTFQVEDPSILQVDATGKVTALRSGTTRVIVGYGSAMATVTITVVGEGASQDFTLRTSHNDSTIQVKVAAGTVSGQDVQGPIYAVRTQLQWDPNELQLLNVRPELFIGTTSQVTATDTLYELGNQPTGYQSMVTTGAGIVDYLATKVGNADETSASSHTGIATLEFQVQHPGATVQFRVQDMHVAILNQDQVIQVIPSSILAGTKVDIIPPAWPANRQVTADQVGYHGASLTWTEATDEVGVTQYRIYNGSSLIATVDGSARSYTVTELQEGTSYTFSVQAGDAEDNWTTDGPSVTVRTLSEDTPSTPPAGVPATPPKEEKPNPSVPSQPKEPVVTPFKDVTPSYNWASKAIETLTAKGIIQGTSPTTFEPGKTASRADIITLIVRALGIKADLKENFKDVAPDDYYYQPMGVAKALGIVNGTGENIALPEQAISRQDLIVLIVRALQASQPLNVQGNETVLLKFKDAQLVAPYARTSMAFMIELGLVEGDGVDLNPQGTASRAEIAVILARVMDRFNLLKNK
ncbi:S-layer homology domain-containing protein [Paenibacillus whitsoniae]|uniref:S-layer homology domain-containing protein n=1 Tax=Paenibacillus whitsoniae TaxID=2496558 RepID=A0A430JJM5_9BACL|nr:S-layer homology domain-containing protein [Paenibacillus whitsoniae]RTE11254.1 hypothetical protein EJQ19_02935 [Paenibacillus whitsoniae]